MKYTEKKTNFYYMLRVVRLAVGRWVCADIWFLMYVKAQRSCLQNACNPLLNHNMKLGNESLERVAKFKYLEITQTN
jgi:hypothetical protein